MKYGKRIMVVLGIVSILNTSAQNVKILFDATKAETAGNADWVVDANSHNLGFSNGPAVVGQGSESNPQQIPSPAQSGIISTTAESYWQGGLSYWGIDCVKQGYTVESLPYNGRITYGDASNLQDLSHYTVFIICEPNILFTSTEKTAMINFVSNGGGLFMISDHDVSDRNNDGWDSPHIWNNFIDTNSVSVNPFGIHFDYVDISQTSSNIPSLPGDSILHGPFGNVAKVQWSNGTTLTLNPSINPTVKGVVYKTGSGFGNTNVMCAYSHYGRGKVAAIGDSSPCDDGTGDVNDQLYDGYITDAAGNHQKLLMNITIWLAESPLNTDVAELATTGNDFQIFPNPISNSEMNLSYSVNQESPVVIEFVDLTGKVVKMINHQNVDKGKFVEQVDVSTMENGFYICRVITLGTTFNHSFLIQR